MFVQEQDICSALEQSVRSRETSETTTNDDNLSHFDVLWVEVDERITEDVEGDGKVALIRNSVIVTP